MKQARRKKLHVFVMHGQRIRHSPTVSAAARKRFTRRGKTAHFVVSFDKRLGANGPKLADAVLATCERDFTALQGYFGGITPARLPFKILIVPGNGGASHTSCPATEIRCDAFDGTAADLMRMLVVAETDEVFMANQAAGWDCGASNGEGLSRILAAELYPASLNGFATGAAWLDSNRPDFVSQTDPSDTNFVSTGCATLFLNYLRHQLGFPWPRIVQAGGATLAETYRRLTGKADAFAPFAALLAKRFPPGQASGLANDNPFPIP